MTPDEVILALRFLINTDLNLFSLNDLNNLYSQLVNIQGELRKYVEFVSRRRYDLILKNK